jgi:NADPH:quinone reductase-like Zn-dependent oxidoreductase
VTRFAVGDEVLGMPWFPRRAAAFAEYVTAPSRHFVRAPAGLDHVRAAALPLAGLTAWQTLVDTAHLGAGDRVLIHAGAGGVGHLAVQIAKARGAHVTTTAREAKHAFLTQLGADVVVDYTTTRFEDVVEGMDVVLDLIGGETGIRSIPTLRPGGLLIGVPSGNQEAAEAAAAAGLRYTGFLVEPDHAGLEALTALVDAGQLRVEVDRTFPLEQAADALAQGAAGRTQGKLVLTL